MPKRKKKFKYGITLKELMPYGEYCEICGGHNYHKKGCPVR